MHDGTTGWGPKLPGRSAGSSTHSCRTAACRLQRPRHVSLGFLQLRGHPSPCNCRAGVAISSCGRYLWHPSTPTGLGGGLCLRGRFSLPAPCLVFGCTCTATFRCPRGLALSSSAAPTATALLSDTITAAEGLPTARHPLNLLLLLLLAVDRRTPSSGRTIVGRDPSFWLASSGSFPEVHHQDRHFGGAVQREHLP